MKRAIFSTIVILVASSILLWASFQAVQTARPVNDINSSANANDPSPTVMVLPAIIQPAVPSPNGVETSAVGSTSVQVSWDPVVVEGQKFLYQVWRNGKKIATVPHTKFLDVFLIPGQELTYTVITISESGSASTPSLLARITMPTTGGATVTPAPKPTVNTNVPPKNTNTGTPKNTNSTPAPAPAPTPTPAPTLACGNGGSCTAGDVAKHGTRSNCWVYLSPLNKVYNVTSYVSNGNKHPGGDVIAQYCGQNIYTYFMTSANGGKKHSSSALNSTLQAFYIAVFQP